MNHDLKQVYAKATRALHERRWGAAARHFDDVAQRDPEFGEVGYFLAIALLKIPNLDRAEQVISDFLRRQSDHHKGHYVRSLVRLHSQKPQEALADCQRALELYPEFGKARKLKVKLQRLAKSKQESPLAKVLDRHGLEDELDTELRWEGHPRFSAFYMHWVLLLALPFVALFLDGAGADEGAYIVPIAGSFVVITDLVLRRWLTRYRVYEWRIEVERGILWRRLNFSWLHEVRDSSIRRNLWDALTRNSTVTLRTAKPKDGTILQGTDPSKVIRLRGLKRDFAQKIWADLRDRVVFQRRAMKQQWI